MSTSNATARLGDRSLFPLLQAEVYANHAAVSPASQPVVDAARAVIEDVARRGVGAFGTWLAQREQLRADLAHLVGAQAADIGLAPNTSLGLAFIALSLPWRPGDRVATFHGEFPANVTPWQQAARRFGLEVVQLPLPHPDTPLQPWLDRLERELEQGLRVIALSAVQFQTGQRMPLRQVADRCHAHGAWLVVDAAQAVGALPLDVVADGVDFLASGSHKWLMGPEGAGFVYVSPELVAQLEPATAGWLSHEDGLQFLSQGAGLLRYDRPLKPRAEVFEGGNVAAMSFAGLGASVGLLRQLGPQAIFAHTQAWIDRVEPTALALGYTSLRSPEPGRRSAILSLEAPHGCDPVALHRQLVAQGVHCGFPDGRLRLSPHWPSPLAETDRVLQALELARDLSR